ncbi:MAG: DUF732 domain-containing protein [Aeromicrobium sp.]
MKKLLVGTIGALALGLALAAPAYADEASFYEAVQAGGIEPNEAAPSMGQAVCNEIAEGIPEGTTVVSIYTNTSNDITAEHAQVLYDAAAANLCG